LRIAIITTQEGDNYGAVLQAYALRTHLRTMGHDAFLVPLMSRAVYGYAHGLRGRLRALLRYGWKNLPQTALNAYKRRLFTAFRNRFIYEGNPKRVIAEDVLHEGLSADAYVVGSDQIWNPQFCPAGTPDREVYWLGFKCATTKRIAYAASFGVDTLTEADKADLAPRDQAFSAIGVREKNALSLVAELGAAAAWTTDPTLLLDAPTYAKQLWGGQRRPTNSVYQYALGWPTECRLPDLTRAIASQLGASIRTPFPPPASGIRGAACYHSPVDWVRSIHEARFVVTNSFHGVLFCCIFRTPFCVSLLTGKAALMNTRLESFMDRIGVHSRIARDASSATVGRLLDTPIDWENAHERIAEWRKESVRFLDSALA
jgi:hypothetical protein